jgi:N-acetylneuraminate synthase
VSPPSAPFLIAEAGVNHNGDLGRALAMVDAAAAAGVDAVKFQSFRTDALASRHAGAAPYQKAACAVDDQRALLRRLELDEDRHAAIIERCRARGIEFLSTPFDLDSLAFLAGTGALRRLKLGSGEVTNGPLLLAAARTGLPLILSTGMATLEEIGAALALLAHGYGSAGPPAGPLVFTPAVGAALAGRVTLLHCTTAYPAPPASINLRAMETLGAAFGLPVGFSDHSQGLHIAVAAAARGAGVIEKHFTLDRALPGPDHAASLEPDELAALARQLREVAAALGDGDKRPAAEEAANAAVARRSLVAARPIRRGEPFAADNVTSKRPAGGLNPMRFWDLLGRPAPRDYETDDPIAPDTLP